MNKTIVTHHGEIIRRFIEDNRIAQKTFCITIGLNPSNFVSTLNKDVVTEKYRQAIEAKYGLVLPYPDANEVHVPYGDSPNNCKELLAAKEETIVSLREQIALLKEIVTDLKNQKK
jgi:hypothetical protein